MKTFKNLFIRDDNEDDEPPSSNDNPGFPVSESTPSNAGSSNNPYLEEILEVYEKGLESINMPGYDFFDFYKAIKAAGANSESVYKMAFQMGRTLDPNITSQKLVSDAEYYISKLNDVYQSYSDQGRQKLNAVDTQLIAEKEKLSKEASHIEAEINKMKQQIQSLEKSLAETRDSLGKIDQVYKPEQETIQQKLSANEKAKQVCVQKLNSIKDNISKYLK